MPKWDEMSPQQREDYLNLDNPHVKPGEKYDDNETQMKRGGYDRVEGERGFSTIYDVEGKPVDFFDELLHEKQLGDVIKHVPEWIYIFIEEGLENPKHKVFAFGAFVLKMKYKDIAENCRNSWSLGDYSIESEITLDMVKSSMREIKKKRKEFMEAQIEKFEKCQMPTSVH